MKNAVPAEATLKGNMRMQLLGVNIKPPTEPNVAPSTIAMPLHDTVSVDVKAVPLMTPEEYVTTIRQIWWRMRVERLERAKAAFKQFTEHYEARFGVSYPTAFSTDVSREQDLARSRQPCPLPMAGDSRPQPSCLSGLRVVAGREKL